MFQQEHQTVNGTTTNGSALKSKALNGQANGAAEVEEHDEDQYLELIRKIMKKGKDDCSLKRI